MANLESCKKALFALREEIRAGVLDETIPLWFHPSTTNGFLGEITCQVDNFTWVMSVTDTCVVYHNPAVQGLFANEEDFTKLKEIVKRHLNPGT